MKKYNISMLLFTVLLCLFWMFRSPAAEYLFPCEGFGCIGSGIGYASIYAMVAIIGYLTLGLYQYKITKNLLSPFLSFGISITIVVLAMIIQAILQNTKEQESLENAYEECMSAFSGKSPESSYCETYR